MSPRFQTGLVVGKFAPLHRGHLRVIEAARSQCRRTIVLSYINPELSGFPASLREGWLRDCVPDIEVAVLEASVEPGMPDNEASDDAHRDFVARWLLARRLTVDAVFTSESYGQGFADWLEDAYVSAGFQRHVVAHVPVDPDRTIEPISGTQLRNDPWQYWRWLPAPVAKTLVKRVAFLGGESTGKSTLARHLAERWQTSCVEEYGRERWEACNGALQFEDMEAIAREQVRREEAAVPKARRYVFCDSSPLTTLFYSEALFGTATVALRELARRPYDLTVLCAADFAFVQDGTRQTAAFRDRQQTWYADELTRRGIPYLVARGSLQERLEAVEAIAVRT